MTAQIPKDNTVIWTPDGKSYVQFSLVEVEDLLDYMLDDEYFGKLSDLRKCQTKDCPEYGTYQLYKKLKRAKQVLRKYEQRG